MTDLSPAAQAVRMGLLKIWRRLQRYCKVDYCPRNPLPITIETDTAGLEAAINDLVSAAICAVAMQTLLTSEHYEGSTPNDYELGWNAAVAYIQNIATELEAL